MRVLTAGFAALALALGLGLAAGAASAQTAPATAPIAAAPGALSVETTSIGDLLADPGGLAVLTKDMPALISYPGLDQIKGMTLRGISVYPEAQLDDAKLAAIQKDLDAAKKK
jgi:hypothetical protein